MKKLYIAPLLLMCFCLLANETKAAYCTPSYKGSGFGGTGKPTSFFTHILEVHFADLNNVVSAPTANPSPNYDTFFSMSTDLVRNYSYNMTIKVGNGANPQCVVVWIDWNQNEVFESSEKVLAKSDPANSGTHVLTASVKIPSNAPLGKTIMRVGTKYGSLSPDPCTNNTNLDWSQHFQDYTVNVVEPDVQYYVSSTSSHPTHDDVIPGSSDNQILQIIVRNNTAGSLQAQTSGDFKFSLTGTTNPADILAAKLYYTGKDTRFSVAKQVGTSVSKPGTFFTIKAGQTLEPGDNYFWLVYDVDAKAIIGNEIDARISSVDVGGTRVPSVTSPQGVRKVGYCVSHGVKNNFVFVYSVVLNGINKYVYAADTNGYGDYTWLATTLFRKKKYKLSVGAGNGYNPSYERVWIDWNRDGDFNDVGEQVLFDSINASTTSFSVGPVSDSITVPPFAKPGPTRMRVTASYQPVPYTKVVVGPCSNPVEIGEIEDYTILIADTGEAVSSFTNNTACFGSATNFKDASYTYGSYAVNSWLWDFGDGDTSSQQNPSHTYKKSGVYTVSLTTHTGKPGANSVFKKTVVVEEPKADFEVYGSVYKTNIQFADQTTGGRVMNWFWDFGDPKSGANNISMFETPTHSFDTAGTYVVKLRVITSGGCIDSITKTIKIVTAIPPVANFSMKTYNPYFLASVNITDVSVNVPTSWQWTFSPIKVTFYKGTNDKSQNPVVSFDSLPCTYKVTLKVTNSAGSDTQSKFITTKSYKKPMADFSANKQTLKAGQLVTFLDSSQNDPIYWNWKFGNGDSSAVQHPVYKYKNSGVFDVTLKASNPSGSDAKTKYKYITVTNNYHMCDPDAPSSTVFSGTIADDGDSTNYKNNSTCGFLIDPDCNGPITLSFDSFFMYPNDYIRIYDGVDNTGIKLFSGAGITGNKLPANVVANSSGAMYIEEITDRFFTQQGFRATWSALPNFKPSADFKLYDSVAYLGTPCDFANTTSTGITNTYSWDFDGDGKLDAIGVDNPTYVYTKTGYYKVKLIAGNCKGKDSVTKTIHVINSLKKPTVDFVVSADTITINDSLSLFDKSTGGANSWEWSFNPDSATYQTGFNTSRNPVVNIPVTGSYDVKLKVTNAKGTDSLTKKHIVYVKDEANLCASFITDKPYGKLYDEGGRDVDYNDFKSCGFLIQPCGAAIVLKFNYFDLENGDWIFIYDGVNRLGKKLDSFTSSSLLKTYSYTATSGALYIEQRNFPNGVVGMGFDADWYTIPFTTPKSSFLTRDTGFVNSPHRFEGTTTGVVSKWEWDFDGDGVTDDTAKNSKFIYTKTGTYTARLIVSRCISMDTSYRKISVINATKTPTPDFIADLLTADISDTVSFKDLSGQGPTSWLWDITPKTYNYAGGTDSTIQDPKVNFYTAGDYSVTLTSTNSFGSANAVKVKYIHVLNYCTPSITTTGSTVGISRVKLGTIDNKTAVSITGYTDYTQSISTNLEQRSRNTFTIERLKQLDSIRWKIWIDYNQNGLFTDAGEQVAVSPKSMNRIWTDSFKIPGSAKLGSTRMRIGAGLPSDPNTPCGTNSYGEYEDYRIIITKDFSPPVITVIGSNPASVEVGYSYTDSGAKAWDNIEGDVSKNITVKTNVDTGKVGTYQVRYNVKDSSGNAAVEVVRSVYITADKTPPVVTLNGSNPQQVGVFTKYTELGATAIDNRDGNVSTNIAIDTSEVKVNVVGSYNVYYTAVDKSKNYATRVTRVVDVVDTSKPVIYLNTKDTIVLGLKSSWTDPTTVKDNYDPTPKLNKTGSVNTNVSGTYTISYNAYDAYGNTAAPRKRTVIVNMTGVENSLSKMELKIYPVPAKDNLVVSIKLPEEKLMYVELLNSLGQVVMTKPVSLSADEEFVFPVHNLAAGIYLLKVKTGDEVTLRKVEIDK